MKYFLTLLILLSTFCFGETLNETKKLAEKGDSKAQLELAKQYVLLSSPTEAIKWLKLSAEQNNTEALVMLGKQYEIGLIIKKNFAKSLELYTKAAENGSWNGQYNLAKMYLNGIGVLQDYVLAFAWLNEASLSGDSMVIHDRDILTKMMSPNQLEQGRELSKNIHEKLSKIPTKKN